MWDNDPKRLFQSIIPSQPPRWTLPCTKPWWMQRIGPCWSHIFGTIAYGWLIWTGDGIIKGSTLWNSEWWTQALMSSCVYKCAFIDTQRLNKSRWTHWKSTKEAAWLPFFSQLLVATHLLYSFVTEGVAQCVCRLVPSPPSRIATWWSKLSLLHRGFPLPVPW